MSEAKFTKGDVKVIKHLLSDTFDLRVGFCGHREGELIAKVVSGEDDANLLGSASAMYEMLEQLYLNACLIGNDDPIYDEIKELLAKARGEHK